MARLVRALRSLIPLVVLTAAAVASLPFAWRHMMDSPGPLPAARNVVVPHGTVPELAQALTAEGLIAPGWAPDWGDSAWPFRLAVYLTRGAGELHAGEFAFPAHASLRTVLAVLRTAQPVRHKITIPEGLTAPQIMALLARAEALSGPDVPVAEGSVLPQTYDYTYGTPRAAIVARAAAALDRVLAQAWAGRASNLPLANPREALILASIVERETALPAERPMVAAVFLNRLRAGMRLQSDPTTIYAASEGMGVLDHPLTRAELDRDDPFNTYRAPGLPPGPICAPGLATITAVLHPADTDALYFVADGSGGHAFSRTLAEHNRNVQHARAQAQLPLPPAPPAPPRVTR
ncbi:MAG: endolytic transglycosylase MltG [Proteobacteria bacterium]|nr:endolytic transglycosylase MltG [Pseudomonadota bacterium]